MSKGEEYKKCSVLGEEYHYTEFTKAKSGWLAVDGTRRHPQSKVAKRINMSLSNGLRVRVGDRLVGINHDLHPNNKLYEGIKAQVFKENNFVGHWGRTDLTKEIYLKTYEALEIDPPDLNRVKYKAFGLASKEEQKCLDHLGVPEGEDNRQVRLSGTRYDVDGLVGNTAYEFMGDFWHANPKIYKPDHKIKGYTAQEKWDKDRQRAEVIKSMGYELVIIWESDWNEFKQGIVSELKTEKW